MQNEAPSQSPLEGLPVWVSDAKNIWPTLRIAQTIPLGRLEWVWSSRGISIRDSSTSARALFTVSTGLPDSLPKVQEQSKEWFRNPYVYILVTDVKELDHSNDLPTWSHIRRFVDDCREKYHEYLIILSASEGELIHRRRIVEKLRSEVNLVSRGRERVVIVPPATIREELRPITHLHHSPSHQDLLVRLRECMRDGVEARVQAYEEEVARSYLNRSNSQWSFSSFFALKEGMAFVFLQLGRRDLAVKFYDELQVAMGDQGDCGWVKFCDLPAAEVARGVTNPDERDYRGFLQAKAMTEVDMRTYLFSRQISMILVDRKFSEVAERGLKFITAIARRCAEETLAGNEGISAVFRDTWVFTTASALAAVLAPAIPSQSEASHALSAQLSTPRERHTARLVAGFHVHALKAFLGLAHVVLPGCLGADESPVVGNRDSLAAEAKSTSNEKLKEALSSPKKAEQLHSVMANAAASLYEMGGRARGAAALDGDAGMVRLRNKSYSEAETLLSAQCSRFTNDNGWDVLHRRPRVELARAEKELDRVQEYLVSCLTMLYMTRESRLLESGALHREQTEDAIFGDASHWAAEAGKTASRLPRVMKYKADRLFEVSVLPNNVIWNEGDPGSATVRVISDLPTSLTVNYVMLECKCVNVRNGHKPALHHRDGEGSSIADLGDDLSASKGSAPLTSPASTSSAAAGPDYPDTVVLRSEASVNIRKGVNDIQVNIDEIPHFGRYKVTLVAMFLGNLKFVQAASKMPLHPIVTTKGKPANKGNDASSSTALVSDFANCDVKFPIFFASQREPSASVVIDDRNPLYLAPHSVQYLKVTIRAGEHGLAKGSKLIASLSPQRRARVNMNERIVRFADVSEGDSEGQDQVLRMSRVEDGSTDVDSGEAIIPEELEALQALEAKLALELLPESGALPDSLEGEDPSVCSCDLHLEFVCREKESIRDRPFSCEADATLLFAPPIDVAARVQLNSEWGGDSLSRAVGLDGTPLGDGGSLLCFIRNTCTTDERITLTKITLEVPPWLELRPDEPPSHVSLLPCTTNPEGVFACVFDVLVREQEQTEQYQLKLDAQDVPFGNDAVQRRLSRKLEISPDTAESQDDFPGWKADTRGGESSPQSRTSGETLEFRVGGASSKGNNMGPAYNGETLSEGGTNESPRLSVTTEHEDGISVKEAQDVVDLSTPGENANVSSGAMSSPPTSARGDLRCGELATLRVNLEISGMAGETCIERKVSMNAFRITQKRYRIDRKMDKVGDCGKTLALEFTIRGLGVREGNDEDGEEETALQYEVDADPDVWLVVGRRRGKVTVRGGMTATGGAEVIPLVCGRHIVPGLRLFTRDGRGLPFSRYENVNELMEVVIMPCQTIVSACSQERLDRKKGGSGKGKLPDVIAADSFFGS